MTTFVATIIFILGACIGSFLSVVIYRLHKNKKGIVFSRSMCPNCKKPLKARHLIPILSFVFLRGKCAYCQKTISAHYFMLEIITGIVFLMTFLKWNFLIVTPSIIDPAIFDYAIDWSIFALFAFYIVEMGLLMGIFFFDVMYKIIPDSFSIPAIIIAIAGGLAFKNPYYMSMLYGGVGFFLFFFAQFFFSKGKWLGGGDIRIAILIGVLLGWEKGLLALILAYFTASIAGIALLIQKKAKLKSQLPFAPFLIIGILIALHFGKEIIDYYLSLDYLYYFL
ncbi:MAG: prepilin peptidase [Candidatus Gracilibacteria bacterium]|jgi:prepilin signal peptidase PulO-like enzyme (type II secretory pathway)